MKKAWMNPMHRGIGTRFGPVKLAGMNAPGTAETVFDIAGDLLIRGRPELQEASAGMIPKTAEYLVRIALVAPDFVGEDHAPVFVPP